MSYVYFIGDGVGPVKIGTSTKPQRRLETMQVGNPNVLLIEALVVPPDINAYMYEAALHNALGAHRVRGEWFARVAASPVIEAVNEAQAWTLILSQEDVLRVLSVAQAAGRAAV